MARTLAPTEAAPASVSTSASAPAEAASVEGPSSAEVSTAPAVTAFGKGKNPVMFCSKGCGQRFTHAPARVSHEKSCKGSSRPVDGPNGEGAPQQDARTARQSADSDAAEASAAEANAAAAAAAAAKAAQVAAEKAAEAKAAKAAATEAEAESERERSALADLEKSLGGTAPPKKKFKAQKAAADSATAADAAKAATAAERTANTAAKAAATTAAKAATAATAARAKASASAASAARVAAASVPAASAPSASSVPGVPDGYVPRPRPGGSVAAEAAARPSKRRREEVEQKHAEREHDETDDGGDDDEDDGANGLQQPVGTVAWSSEVRCERGRRCYAQYGHDGEELWFKATVVAVHRTERGQLIDVEYDDGDEEKRKPMSRIRALPEMVLVDDGDEDDAN